MDNIRIKRGGGGWLPPHPNPFSHILPHPPVHVLDKVVEVHILVIVQGGVQTSNNLAESKRCAYFVHCRTVFFFNN